MIKGFEISVEPGTLNDFVISVRGSVHNVTKIK